MFFFSSSTSKLINIKLVFLPLPLLFLFSSTFPFFYGKSRRYSLFIEISDLLGGFSRPQHNFPVSHHFSFSFQLLVFFFLIASLYIHIFHNNNYFFPCLILFVFFFSDIYQLFILSCHYILFQANQTIKLVKKGN